MTWYQYLNTGFKTKTWKCKGMQRKQTSCLYASSGNLNNEQSEKKSLLIISAIQYHFWSLLEFFRLLQCYKALGQTKETGELCGIIKTPLSALKWWLISSRVDMGQCINRHFTVSVSIQIWSQQLNQKGMWWRALSNRSMTWEERLQEGNAYQSFSSTKYL